MTDGVIEEFALSLIKEREEAAGRGLAAALLVMVAGVSAPDPKEIDYPIGGLADAFQGMKNIRLTTKI